MYAPPPAVVAPAPRRNGLAAGGPLLAICCLLFILFLVASTIVLALIPVYVERDIDPVGNSQRYTAVMTPQNANLGEGQFDQNSLNNFNAASNTALGVNSGAVNAESITSTQGTRKRRRRGFGLVRERRAIGTGYCKFRFNRRRCNTCGTKNFLSKLKSYTITIDINILLTAGGSQPLTGVTFIVIIILADITVPSPVGSGSGSGSITGRLAG